MYKAFTDQPSLVKEVGWVIWQINGILRMYYSNAQGNTPTEKKLKQNK